MEDKNEKILQWLENHDLITILRLETKLKIPKNLIGQCIRGLKPLPNKHVDALETELKKYGYK
jgi:hypothetical protein